MSDNVGSYTGIVAIPNPTRRYSQWHIREVYGLGGALTNVNIPNVDDTVIDLLNNKLYKVVSLSVENIPSLEVISLRGTGGVGAIDTILGTGPGLCSEGYRIYVNNKILPHPCFIDNRVIIPGSANNYIKIFKGHATSGSENVISGVFNSVGRMVSENIPLEHVVIPHYPANTYKVATGGHLTETLEEGEVVTVVVYTGGGDISLRFSLLVVNTEFVRNIDASKKHVTDISLITPYISESDNSVIEIPVGMTTTSASFIGKVTYNDGSQVTYPVDGIKFALHGFDTYVASRAGETMPMILRYTLSPTENANIVQTVGNKHFTNRQYTLKTVESDNQYSVKLFVIPVWDKIALAWTLRYWLYNLSRDSVVDVTSMIEYSTNSLPFNGSAYGETQRITAIFNLTGLGPSYSYYRHVETFELTITHPITTTDVGSYYVLKYDSDSVVGANTLVNVSGLSSQHTLDFSNGFDDYRALLNLWYRSTSPLVHAFNEERAPDPTHVRVITGNWSREIPVTELTQAITNVTATISNGQSVQLEFVRLTSVNRLELGKVGLIARLV